jgi:hypothetical protein
MENVGWAANCDIAGDLYRFYLVRYYDSFVVAARNRFYSVGSVSGEDWTNKDWEPGVVYQDMIAQAMLSHLNHAALEASLNGGMIQEVWDMAINSLVEAVVLYGECRESGPLLDTIPVIDTSTRLLSNDATLGVIDLGEEGAPTLVTYLRGGFLLCMSVPLYPLIDKEWWSPANPIPACVSHNMQDAMRRLRKVGYMGAATGGGIGAYPYQDDMSAFVATQEKLWTI